MVQSGIVQYMIANTTADTKKPGAEVGEKLESTHIRGVRPESDFEFGSQPNPKSSVTMLSCPVNTNFQGQRDGTNGIMSTRSIYIFT